MKDNFSITLYDKYGDKKEFYEYHNGLLSDTQVLWAINPVGYGIDNGTATGYTTKFIYYSKNWISGWAIGSGTGDPGGASASGEWTRKAGSHSCPLYTEKGYNAYGPFVWQLNQLGQYNTPFISGVSDGNAKNTSETYSSPRWGSTDSTGYTHTMSIDTGSANIVYSWFLDTTYPVAGTVSNIVLTTWNEDNEDLFAYVDVDPVAKTSSNKLLFRWTVSF